MSHTWRAARRLHGVKKTREHVARAKWSARNRGARLRSLRVDLFWYDHLRQDALDDGAPIDHARIARRSA